ncbi:MAG: hypothetical protein RLZZ455_398 [Candidatus Parcubacteria bacterium]|jgi:glycosyltransferase involved in cell wall biosynthesis
MNILLLNWRDPKNPRSGGAEHVTLMHAKAWIAAGHTVTWLSSSFPGSPSNENIAGINVIRCGNSVQLLFFVPYFYSKNRQRFDVVIDEIHGIPFFTPLYVRVPIIAFIHEIAGDIWDFAYTFPVNVIGRIIERVSLRLYRSVQFWTDGQSTIRELIAHGIPKNHCVSIPCPIDNKVVRVLPKKEKKSTFIFVGRLVPMKGVEDAIRAFAIIRTAFPSSSLWIVGQGDERYIARLHEVVGQLGLRKYVQFFGYVSQEKKLELMKRSHVLLHPSVKEGWGLVVLEAASQGTPTIGYNVAGLQDTILQGKTGILVTPRSPQDMAAAGIILLKDVKSYVEIQKKCLRFAGSFSWSNSVAASLRLIDSVISKSPVTVSEKL